MSLFCDCDKVNHDLEYWRKDLYEDILLERKLRKAADKDHEKRLEILERLFKESKPYKKAECEVLKEYAEQG